MSSSIIKIKDFKIENVKLSEVRQTKKGTKTIYINYDYEDGGSPKKLIFSLPRLKSPFGISGIDVSRPKGEQGTINMVSNDSIELSIDKENEEVLEKLKSLEELIIGFAVKNSKDLLGKKYKEDMVREFYSSFIKYSIDKKEDKVLDYPPRLKCKLSKNEKGEYVTNFYYSKNEKIVINTNNYSEAFPKMSDCLSIVSFSNVWVVGGKFGASCRPEQVKIFKNENALQEYAFDDEDEERNDVTKDMNDLVLDSVEDEEDVDVALSDDLDA